jgi:hypothetical protein
MRRRCVRQASTQEVAHSFYLNFGFLVVLRIGLQDMLNDGRVDGNHRLLEATYMDPECVTEGFVVAGQNLHRIASHRARIRKAVKPGDNGNRH